LIWIMMDHLPGRIFEPMRPLWIDAYPPGVPAEIDARAYSSLNELFERSCERYADLTAFTCLGGSLTYAEVGQLARHFAAALQQRLALARGERIAIMLPNLLQYPVALFGALRAGLVVVNVNPLYTADELALQLDDSGATALLVLDRLPRSPIGKTLRRALAPHDGTGHG